MIIGLYEAHLPVSNLKKSIEFYIDLGLDFDHSVEDKIAFLWIEKDKSWLGLWETDKVEIEYHPSIRHIAFQVSLERLKNSVSWLKHIRDMNQVKHLVLSLLNPLLWLTMVMHTPKYILMIQMEIV